MAGAGRPAARSVLLAALLLGGLVGLLGLAAAAIDPWAYDPIASLGVTGGSLDADPHGCVARLFSEQDGGPHADPTEVTNVFFVKFDAAQPTLAGDEVCGLESAMRLFAEQLLARPNITVCLYVLTTADFAAPATVASLYQLYGLRPNVLYWSDYLARWRRAGTLPHLLDWYDRGAWRQGYVLHSLSHGLRVALLYNHGGAYFDLDLVHLGSPERLANYLSWQSPGGQLSPVALRFQRQHPFLEAVSRRFVEQFDGSQWGHNGPKRFTETYREFCEPASATAAAPAWCSELRILPPHAYQPVVYEHRAKLYKEAEGRSVRLGADTYGVHLWTDTKQHRLADTVVQTGSVLHRIAQQVCPVALLELGLGGLAPGSSADGGGSGDADAEQRVPKVLSA